MFFKLNMEEILALYVYMRSFIGLQDLDTPKPSLCILKSKVLTIRTDHGIDLV